jgi:hypothetical protein
MREESAAHHTVATVSRVHDYVLHWSADSALGHLKDSINAFLIAGHCVYQLFLDENC